MATATMSKKYSTYQQNIFDWVHKGEGHGAINAVAGSGKTTTGVDAMDYIDMFQDVLFTAFNRHIKNELTDRTKHMGNVKVNTYNGLGWGVCLRSNRHCKLEQYKTDIYLKKVIGFNEDKKYQRFRSPINRLVSLFKGTLCFNRTQCATEYKELILHHDLGIPSDKDFESILMDVYMKVIDDTSMMDFDDQIFMPLYHDWVLPYYDFVMVDEFQDTNLMQSQFVKGCLKNSASRMMVFGDPWQAIYGFRGATPGAMKTWVEENNARELPLSICYRCPKAVVREAQRIVKHIEAAPGAGEGSVQSISTGDFTKRVADRDFVLCRTTAPLISACLGFIREGRAASVRGREVGDQLVSLVKTVCNGKIDPMNGSIREFSVALDDHFQTKHANLVAMERENLAQQLSDKVETLRVIMEKCNIVGQIVSTIGNLFDDNQHVGIQLMTCHKAKGLQNPNVFVLNPEQLSPEWNSKKAWQKEEQKRLKYVTITRAQENLYYVSE